MLGAERWDKYRVWHLLWCVGKVLELVMMEAHDYECALLPQNCMLHNGQNDELYIIEISSLKKKKLQKFPWFSDIFHDRRSRVGTKYPAERNSDFVYSTEAAHCRHRSAIWVTHISVCPTKHFCKIQQYLTLGTFQPKNPNFCSLKKPATWNMWVCTPRHVLRCEPKLTA